MTAKIDQFLNHNIIFPDDSNTDNVLVYILDSETGHQILFNWDDELVTVKDTVTQELLSTYIANYHTFLMMFVDLNPVDDVYAFLVKNDMLDLVEAEPEKSYCLLRIRNHDSGKVFFQIFNTEKTKEQIIEDVQLELRTDEHWNKHLQNSWNKHYYWDFVFEVFPVPEYVDGESLMYYLNKQKNTAKQQQWELYNYEKEYQNW